MEKLVRVPPPHPSQVKMVSSPNVPTDNLDSQGSILPSYSKELEEYCQFSVADEVNAIVYIGFACFEIYSRPNSPRSSSRFCRAGHTSGVAAKFAREAARKNAGVRTDSKKPPARAGGFSSCSRPNLLAVSLPSPAFIT